MYIQYIHYIITFTSFCRHNSRAAAASLPGAAGPGVPGQVAAAAQRLAANPPPRSSPRPSHSQLSSRQTNQAIQFHKMVDNRPKNGLEHLAANNN